MRIRRSKIRCISSVALSAPNSVIKSNISQIGFLTEWQLYAQKLEGDMWRGEKLDKGKIDKMSDQQLGQLYELLQEIQRAERDEGEGRGNAA